MIPKNLLDLSCLYILAFIKEANPITGGRTRTTRLKNIAPISTNLCNKIAHNLKKQFANLVAMRYELLLDKMDGDLEVNSVSVDVWGKYIRRPYLRTDKHGLLYASSLFSMQVCLAYLIVSGSKVAIINDLMTDTGELKGRYVRLFEGDGHIKLRALQSNELFKLDLFHTFDPVVVIGGCAYSNDLDIQSLTLQMDFWVDEIMRLILACDVFYPQFPAVTTDSEFKSSPIKPEEPKLNNILEKTSLIKGVSAVEPTLFCSTHIYTASVGQVRNLMNNMDEDSLPISILPGRVLSCSNKINELATVAT
jgi:hypothetical protein